MTKSGVHRLYTGCTQVVLTAMCLGASGFAAQAGAWEEFERRCLVPMENVETPITAGYDDETGPGFAQFEKSVEDFFVGVNKHPNLQCGVFFPTTSAGTVKAKYEAWRDEQFDDATYEFELSLQEFADASGEQLNAGSSVEELKPVFQDVFDSAGVISTTWREPKIRVHFHAFENEQVTPYSFVFVVETDLES